MQNDERNEVQEQPVPDLAQRVSDLEKFCAAQHLALQKLGKVVEGHQRIHEAQTGYVPPKADPRSN
jgi:hypothetical protein